MHKRNEARIDTKKSQTERSLSTRHPPEVLIGVGLEHNRHSGRAASCVTCRAATENLLPRMDITLRAVFYWEKEPTNIEVGGRSRSVKRQGPSVCWRTKKCQLKLSVSKTNRPPSFKISMHVQSSQIRFVRGCEKFVLALAYLFCLALLGACLARFTTLFRELCIKHELDSSSRNLHPGQIPLCHELQRARTH